MNLRIRKAHAERVEQLSQLGLVDFAVAISVDALEAVTQRITHGKSVRWFAGATKLSALAMLGALACKGSPPESSRRPHAVEPPTASPLHPAAASDSAPIAPALPPLQSAWLVELPGDGSPYFVAPPLGATAPRPLIVGVHGAGDRPEWSCGGWRLAAQAAAFVVCPRGRSMGGEKLAWASPTELSTRVELAVTGARERFAAYVDPGPMIFAGFSQGATFAEPFLRANAARFPIVILAEGGYATAQSAKFARAFHEAGGRRVVLVCGTPGCFASGRSAQKLLERAGLQVLVVGDPKAGHNLNERMQKALQAAWPEIAAPLSP